MQIDYVAVGIISAFVVFSIIMFVVIRSQSKKSEHPEATMSNASDPTPLNHAPDGSQSEYSRSVLSLNSLKKPSSPDPEMDKIKEEGKKFKRRLFFEDTADDGLSPRRGSHFV
ncbi:hypothetical protein PMZ80_007888 [Knufia obscura]|uniref:Uncharacterized protein n=2 Tax=Knufia TaxID=430999 RepID=A0AAN8EAR4_9EURO|nr:hypothetical protein PMZ80_007888 [Knufia obscura]KAK5949465.1 hypothetical protein OHC33_009457 [Knufia fluminis]